MLVIALALQALSLAAFAANQIVWEMPVAVLVALASSSGIMALGFVAFYAQFMHWSDPRQGGIEFTLFQSIDALVRMGGGAIAGGLRRNPRRNRLQRFAR